MAETVTIKKIYDEIKGLKKARDSKKAWKNWRKGKQHRFLNLKKSQDYKMFEIQLSSHAKKFLNKADEQLAKRIIERIENYEESLVFISDIEKRSRAY